MLNNGQAKLRTVFLIGLLVILSPAWAMAGKGNGKGNSGPGDPSDPAINPPADVYVNDDFPGATLLSDAGRVPPFGDGRWYYDGTDGVYALINNSNCDDLAAPGCNDGIFDPDLDAKQRDLRNGNTRYVTIFLNKPAVGGCVGEGGDVYCDVFGAGAFLNVDHMADVSVGEENFVTKDAIMHIPGGTLFFSPLVEAIASDADGITCAWRVTLDGANPGGDVADLKVQSSPGEWIDRGSYHFPFQLEFWLQNASSCNLVGP